MRPIRYRIWEKDEDYPKMHNDVLSDIGEHDNFDAENSCWSVCYAAEKGDDSKFVWMQMMDIVDENKKEIYEGDILKHEDDYLCVVRFGEHYVFDNRHSSYGFYLDCLSEDGNFHTNVRFDFEGVIVGNIYENPELLIKN